MQCNATAMQSNAHRRGYVVVGSEFVDGAVLPPEQLLRLLGVRPAVQLHDAVLPLQLLQTRASPPFVSSHRNNSNHNKLVEFEA